MSIFKRIPTGGKGGDFEYPPAEATSAVLVSIIDMGTHTVPGFDGKKDYDRHSLLLVWELPGVNQSNGTSFVVANEYTLSMNKKAGLRILCRDWRGRDFTDEEAANFELESMLGQVCTLDLQEKTTKKNNTITVVAGATRLDKRLPVPVATLPKFSFDICSTNPLPTHAWLPFVFGEAVGDKIKRSREWKNGRKPVDEPAGNGGGNAAPVPAGVGADNEDDDVPF